MVKETKYSIKDLKADFPTEEACLAFIFDALHSKECSCGGTYRQVKGRKQFQCSRCRFQIAPCTGTIFHKSDTPLSLWFHAIWIFSNAKSGISAKELERQLGVTYKCAWRILSQIRKILKQDDDFLNGIVETDIGYIGGRKSAGENNKNLSESFKAKSKVIIATERGGRVRAKVVENAGAETIDNFMFDNVKAHEILITDNAKTYKRLDRRYERHSVDHGKGEYVRGPFHINTVETWISHVKRSMKGTFKSVSKKHLQSYLDAFAFHYNNRGNDKARFGSLLGVVLRTAK